MVNVAAETETNEAKIKERLKKLSQKKLKKLLTNIERCGKVNKLSLRQTKKQNLDNKTVYSNPENSYKNFWNKT